MNAEQMRWSKGKEKGEVTEGRIDVEKRVSRKLDSSKSPNLKIYFYVTGNILEKCEK